MKCQEIQPRLGELLDGELTGDLRAEVQKHLDRCPICRATLEAERSLVARLAAWSDPAPAPGELWDSISDRLDRRAVPRAGVRLRFPLTRLMAAAAALAFAVGLGWLAVKTPWESQAGAAEIDFRPLLEQAGADLEGGIAALIAAHGGRPITMEEAAREMTVRVHPPAEMPHSLQLKSTHMLNMGKHHRSLALHFAGPRGQLLVLQCPANVRKKYGNRECLPCKVGGGHGEVVRAGPLRLMHTASEHVCICVVSTLDEDREIPSALDALKIDF